MLEAQRAKSEERHREEQKENIRPLVRSTCNSMEKLRSSSAASFVYDEEDFCGIYSDPYSKGSWIHISDMDEFHIWQRPDSREGGIDSPSLLSNLSTSITNSELNFKRDYEERTRRMIHRKSYVEALHRKASKTLDSDKIVTVKKTPSGSFGFRIFGDYPTVVTAIEPNMPAENSGLEVGDIIMRINNIYVANSSHNEVLEITKGVSDTMELEVARTCDVLTPSLSNLSSRNLHIFSGPLWKYSQSDEIWVQRHFCLKQDNLSDTMELEVARTCDVLTPSLSNLSSRNLHIFSGPLWKYSQSDEIWVQRHFCLKQDNCLYYYKTESETIPLGALVLHDSSIETTSGLERPHSFRISKPNNYILDLAAESESVAYQWLEYFTKACKSQENIEWLSEASIRKPPSRILNPQHSGHLSFNEGTYGINGQLSYFYNKPSHQYIKDTKLSPHYAPCPTKPILVYSPKTSYATSTSSKTYSHTSDQSSTSYNRLESPSHCPAAPESKEIMIDFKPNPSAEIVRRGRKRILQKTRSEGEILVDPSLPPEGGIDSPSLLSNLSTSITNSELNFKRDYEERTRRMIHRKSYVEALHRKASKTLDSDKIVTVKKTPSGSFGFRIFGDYPTVVTAIEPNMPAENSGLEVGDIIMRINNIYVANSSHNEVLEITKGGEYV
ncbi:uncharacterized protein LOC113465845 [Diaphorina citri]|uniref:Uncharacterized protein LOC113465845 n=1 Tax=Diaphorina citri TaxID=121845 RepID=A0A3Q0IQB9_DIACI|nr:uncharacterized protein LOC113465845 [Diaphorina citri]